MIGVQGQRCLQRCQDVLRARVGDSGVVLAGPVVPRVQIHHRRRIERQHVGIVGIRLGDRGHPDRIRGVEGDPIELWIHAVSFGQSTDESLLRRTGRGRQFPRPTDRLVGHTAVLVGHPSVDVGAGRKGEPPPAHGAVGIELDRPLIGSDRLGVVEGELKPQTLVEVQLGIIRGRADGPVVVTEILIEGHPTGLHPGLVVTVATVATITTAGRHEKRGQTTTDYRQGEQSRAGTEHGRLQV